MQKNTKAEQPKVVHKNLASERVRIGLNQTDCAEQLGIPLKRIVQYESNIDAAPVEFVKRAADFFECSTEYLLDMTDERKPVTAAD
ncbi:MAG: helix-turn-helix transcriptional regulator [Atopobiaceae bacterium]|nr:helix-turn-helix transcriptional regulator [Atopobiaceae bacterium]